MRMKSKKTKQKIQKIYLINSFLFFNKAAELNNREKETRKLFKL